MLQSTTHENHTFFLYFFDLQILRNRNRQWFSVTNIQYILDIPNTNITSGRKQKIIWELFSVKWKKNSSKESSKIISQYIFWQTSNIFFLPFVFSAIKLTAEMYLVLAILSYFFLFLLLLNLHQNWHHIFISTKSI